MSVNKVILVGNVGMNPEVRTTQDGKSVATFSLATSEKWKDKRSGERKEKSEWHRIVILSEGLISIVKNYVKKGMRLYIEGTIQTRKWVDKEGVDHNMDDGFAREKSTAEEEIYNHEERRKAKRDQNTETVKSHLESAVSQNEAEDAAENKRG